MESKIFVQNLSMTSTDSWFIPFDILMIIFTTLVLILAIIFLEKTCHTVSMMLTANSCLSAFVWGCTLLILCIFTFENDVKQIVYQDSLCVFRSYMISVSGALLND